MNLLQDFKDKPFIESVQSFFKQTLQITVNELGILPTNAIDVIGENVVNNFIQDNGVYIYGVVDYEFDKNQTLKNTEDVNNLNEDYAGILIIAIIIKNEIKQPSRTQLADITRAFHRKIAAMPIIVVFKYDGAIAIANTERIPFVDKNKTGEKVGKVSMLKDISIGNPHAAHLRILLELGQNKATTFNELYNHWQKTLNTKELNKKFFKKIANWYFWSVAKSKFPYNYLKTDPKHNDKSDEKLQELANQKATIRFITRIIFVWFLKEKNLIPSNLFDEKYLKNIVKDFETTNSGNYYNAILQNLFFATLNRKNDLREFALDKSFPVNKSTYDVNSLFRYEKLFVNDNPQAIMQLFNTIPFINGGLFDSLDVKPDKTNNIKEEIIDGFSRNKNWQATMPNYLFFENQNVDFDTELRIIYDTKKGNYEVKGLFAIFEEYKFTVEENTPLDVDVALDPYLLGEIFENLLAYYNPETGATARKGSGSFYTPQEIVNYMVEESLKTYLGDDLQDFENLAALNQNQKHQLVKKLADVKILDPACGSGAFPMGVLYKMVDILKTIDPDNSIWKQVQHDKIIGDKIKELENDKKAIANLSDDEVRTKATKAVEDRLQDLETNFNNQHHFDDYTRKLYIIRNCIYGVDIQDVAIQISKLRFFLSLIIDQKNDDIKPLPNLETKFVIANTLIGLEKPKQLMLKNTKLDDLEDDLFELRKKYFEAKNHTEKNKLKVQDKNLRTQIGAILVNDGWNIGMADKIANYDIYNQNAQAEWFDADWMFGLSPSNNNNEIIVLNKQIIAINTQIDATNIAFALDASSKLLHLKLASVATQCYILANEVENIKNKINELFGLIPKGISNVVNEPYNIEYQINSLNTKINEINKELETIKLSLKTENDNGVFDIVIGNPPYGISIKEDYRIKVETFLGKVPDYEIYYYFFEIAKKLLKVNGVKCYIVPNTFLFNVFAAKYRLKLLKNWDLRIIDCTSFKIFEGATVFNAITIFKNSILSNSIKYKVTKETNNFEKLINNSDENISKENILNNNQNWSLVFKLDNATLNLTSKIRNHGNKLCDFFPDFSQGLIAYDKYQGQTKETIKNRIYHFDKKVNSELKNWLWGEDIKKFRLNWNCKEWIDYCAGIANPRNPKFFIGKRLLIREITNPSIFSTLTNEEYYHDPAIIVVKDSDNNLETLCAILNSKLATFYHFNSSPKASKGAFPKILIEDIRNFPILIPKNEQPFITLVNQILSDKKLGKNTTHLEHQIDVMVYHLYDLTFTEAQVIDAGLSADDFEKYKILNLHNG